MFNKKDLLLNIENKVSFNDYFKFKLAVDMYPGEFSHGYGYVIGECGLVENITPSTTALRASRVSSEYGSYYTYVNIFAPLYE